MIRTGETSVAFASRDAIGGQRGVGVFGPRRCQYLIHGSRRPTQGNESRLTKARCLAWNVSSRLKLGFRRLAGRAIRRSSRRV